MTGGTLLISRKVNRHDYFIRKLKAIGFFNVSSTAVERNGLSLVINEIKPKTIIIDVEFYQSASCYMIRDLINKYKDIIFIVVSLMEFPAVLAMWLVDNGVKSFINWNDGEEEFQHGLECVRDGKIYISPDVKDSMNNRDLLPQPAENITERELQIWRYLCSGYYEREICHVLNLSMSTVGFHKTKLFNNIGVRNDKEAIIVAHYLKLFPDSHLNFYSGIYEARPKPNANKRNRRNKKVSNEQ